MNRKIKHNTHPGELFREEIINAYGLTITEVAEMLGVTRPAISNLVNEKAGMSPMMALRIAKVFRSSNCLVCFMKNETFTEKVLRLPHLS